MDDARPLEFFDLSHRWGHGMPQWPGGGTGPSRTLSVMGMRQASSTTR